MTTLLLANATHPSEIFSNYVTATAVIIGGCWALYRWGFAEQIRKKKARPAVDGHLSYDVSLDEDNNRCLVTVHSKWCNRSEYPFRVHTEHTAIRVYSVPDGTTIGPLDLPRDPVCEIYPYRNFEGMHFGSKTENTLVHHFVLEPNAFYALEWELCRRPREGEPDKKYATTISSILDLRPKPPQAEAASTTTTASTISTISTIEQRVDN